jgi:hypothetical protein
MSSGTGKLPLSTGRATELGMQESGPAALEQVHLEGIHALVRGKQPAQRRHRRLHTQNVGDPVRALRVEPEPGFDPHRDNDPLNPSTRECNACDPDHEAASVAESDRECVRTPALGDDG